MKNESVDRLRRLVTARKVVFVVGAGVSMQVTGNDASSSWLGFMEVGVELAARRTATKQDAEEWVEAVTSDVRSGDPNRRLAAEDQVLARLGGADSDGVVQWLRDSVGSLAPVDRAPIEALGALGVPLLTLNYDRLLEQVTGRPSVTWQQPDTMRRVAMGSEQGIIHLHGEWREPSSVVLGSHLYKRIESEKAARDLVSSLSYDNTLVLVGFGAPLDTMQFEPLRNWLTKSPGPQHIRLVSEGERATFSRPDLVDEPAHLQIVEYGRNYGELTPFLRSIRPRTEIGWRKYLGRASFVPVFLGVLAIFAALGVSGISSVLSALGVGLMALMLAEIFARGRASPLRFVGLLASALVSVGFGLVAVGEDSASNRDQPAAVTTPTADAGVTSPRIHDVGQIEQGDIYRAMDVTTKSQFSDLIAAECGSTVAYRVRVHNGGPAALTNVEITASLDQAAPSTSHGSVVRVSAQNNLDAAVVTASAGVRTPAASTATYVRGSTKLLNYTLQPGGESIIRDLPDGVLNKSIDIGTVGPLSSNTAELQFEARLRC